MRQPRALGMVIRTAAAAGEGTGPRPISYFVPR